MRDIRCPRCGSLMGRVDGEAQLRCRRARCYAIVNINTHTGEATMIRHGAGNAIRAAMKRPRLMKLMRSTFAESSSNTYPVALTTLIPNEGGLRRFCFIAERTAYQTHMNGGRSPKSAGGQKHED